MAARVGGQPGESGVDALTEPCRGLPRALPAEPLVPSPPQVVPTRTGARPGPGRLTGHDAAQRVHLDAPLHVPGQAREQIGEVNAPLPEPQLQPLVIDVDGGQPQREYRGAAGQRLHHGVMLAGQPLQLIKVVQP
ncbi:hypothetical protein OHA11_21695 [Streptomyces sp. NBC_00878]|nr:hypothetical protein [Streptomyces sp. NBC_00878]MCX4906902.1 hypothetical protein [Streptomyces sp. NBC_00878]